MTVANITFKIVLNLIPLNPLNPLNPLLWIISFLWEKGIKSHEILSMLSKYVLILIENEFGKQIRYPMDCDELKISISKKTGLNISSSTLKRMFGFYKETEKARLYTLDTIAKYLDYPNWDHLGAASLENDSELMLDEDFDIATLEVGTRITVKYSPGRTLELHFLGAYQFRVAETNSPKLLIGDILEVSSLLKKHPIICKKKIRNDKNIGTYVGGKKDGITYLGIAKQEVDNGKQP